MTTGNSPPRNASRDATSHAVGDASARDLASPVLDSQALLQGHGSITIRHHGVEYRLQSTKLGKLILTK